MTDHAKLIARLSAIISSLENGGGIGHEIVRLRELRDALTADRAAEPPAPAEREPECGCDSPDGPVCRAHHRAALECLSAAITRRTQAERERIAREAAVQIAELNQSSSSFVNLAESIIRAALDAAAQGGEQ